MLCKWLPLLEVMLICIPFFSGDRHLAVSLIDWIAQLGGTKTHDLLLVVDASTNSAGIADTARMCFHSVQEVQAEPVGVQGEWGKGTTNATACNEMWLTASIFIQHKFPKRRWFWLEADAVPTRPSWADEIENEDRNARKPFMGAFVNIPPFEPHMSGIAVYPYNVADYSMNMAVPQNIAWDYAGRRETVGKKMAHFTDLIQHEYRIDGKEPTFPTLESLSLIKPRTAVFHRCKDGTLVARLREKLSGEAHVMGAPGQRSGSIPDSPSIESLLRARIADLEASNAKLREELKRRILESTPVAVAAVASPRIPIPPPIHKVGSPMKKKRTISEAHRQKLKDSWKKRNAAKA